MRSHALTMGYSLNEHGLYKKEKGQKKEDKIENELLTEEAIFEFLKMQYKEPTERVDGTAVIKVDGTPIVDTEVLENNNNNNNKTVKAKSEPKAPKNKTRKAKKEKKKKTLY